MEQDDRETLKLLGLSPLQICLYLKLIEIGKTTVKALSKNSGIVRGDVYRTMSGLYELGIVKKIIASPAMFEAISPEQSLSTLLDHKINETIALGEKTSNLIQALNNRALDNLQEVESDIVLVPATKIILGKRIKLINNAQNYIDIITTWKHYRYFIAFLAQPLQKAIRRGVQARIIVENYQQTKPPQGHRELKKVIENNGSSLKFISTHPSAVISIYDRKEVLMPVYSTALPNQAPVLYSNNRSIVSLSTVYFEHLWQKTEDEAIFSKKSSTT